jgi:hypothetical protein
VKVGAVLFLMGGTAVLSGLINTAAPKLTEKEVL